MLARAEGGCSGAGGVRTRACGMVPSGAAQCEERKGSRPPEPPSLTTTVTAARAALSPSGLPLEFPTVSQERWTKVIGNQACPRQSPAEGAAGMDSLPGLKPGRARAGGRGDLGALSRGLGRLGSCL